MTKEEYTLQNFKDDIKILAYIYCESKMAMFIAYKWYKLWESNFGSEIFQRKYRKVIEEEIYAHFRLSIIESWKLYDPVKPDETISFYSVIDRLKKSQLKYNLENLNSIYCDTKKSDSFDKVKHFRHKHFSHTDRVVVKLDNIDYPIEENLELLKCSESIIVVLFELIEDKSFFIIKESTLRNRITSTNFLFEQLDNLIIS